MKNFKDYIMVDDDPTCNMISKFSINKTFKEARVNVFTVPEKALEFIQDEYCKLDMNSPVCLFLDINMPSMTGWEFLDVFKNFSKQIQNPFTIYILSSSIDQFDIEKASLNQLVSGFISKPLTTQVIDKLVEERHTKYNC